MNFALLQQSCFKVSKSTSLGLETRGTVYSKSTILGVGIYDGEKGYFLSPQDIEKHKDLFQGSSL